MTEGKHLDVGRFIRDQREKANISVRKLAELAGISNPYLSQVERGVRKPSAEILKRLSRALEISANTLYREAGLIDETVSPSVLDAVDNDRYLNKAQKKVLLDMYKALVTANASDNPKGQE